MDESKQQRKVFATVEHNARFDETNPAEINLGTSATSGGSV